MSSNARTQPLLDPFDRRRARAARGLLAEFNAAGVLEAADVHVAQRIAALTEESDERVLLAIALAVRGARFGAVCVDLAEVAQALARPPGKDDAVPEIELPWPEVDAWVAAVTSSRLCTGLGEPGAVLGVRPVLRLEHHQAALADGAVRREHLLYLDRHWREEDQVLADLMARLDLAVPEVDEALLAGSLARLFDGADWEEQRDASEKAARQWTTILTGGPGTGKTASVARMLVLVAEQYEHVHGRTPRIALAAPTGKASARLGESVAREAAGLDDPADQARLHGLTATTLHRLLGWRPDSGTRFKHHRTNPLPFDVVVVDEVSMVSLAQMARLLEAVRPSTRLILVGDPNQLASVEAGAVLKDLDEGFKALHRSDGGTVDTSRSPVAELRTNHRIYTEVDGVGMPDPHPLDEFARCLRRGDVDGALEVLAADQQFVRLVDPAQEPEEMEAVRGAIGAAAYAVSQKAMGYDEHADAELLAARTGQSLFEELDRHRLLCAHREGPFGVAGWNRQVEHLIAEKEGITHYDEWYAGRQVLITTNDRGLGVSNGDIGVVVRLPDGRLRVALRVENKVKLFATTRLSGVETVFAMTVHKSQGSEATAVTVVLPQDESRLLTRELLYTAVTRARQRVTIIGSTEALTAAINLRVQRASGLRSRLFDALVTGDRPDS